MKITFHSCAITSLRCNYIFLVISQNENETQFLEMIKLLVSVQNGGDIVSLIIVMVLITKMMIMRLEEQ